MGVEASSMSFSGGARAAPPPPLSGDNTLGPSSGLVSSMGMLEPQPSTLPCRMGELGCEWSGMNETELGAHEKTCAYVRAERHFERLVRQLYQCETTIEELRGALASQTRELHVLRRLAKEQDRRSDLLERQLGDLQQTVCELTSAAAAANASDAAAPSVEHHCCSGGSCHAHDHDHEHVQPLVSVSPAVFTHVEHQLPLAPPPLQPAYVSPPVQRTAPRRSRVTVDTESTTDIMAAFNGDSSPVSAPASGSSSPTSILVLGSPLPSPFGSPSSSPGSSPTSAQATRTPYVCRKCHETIDGRTPPGPCRFHPGAQLKNYGPPYWQCCGQGVDSPGCRAMEQHAPPRQPSNRPRTVRIGQ